MKYQYVVILRKSGEKSINLLSILLCFGSAVIFALAPFFTGLTNYINYGLAAVLFGSLAFNAVVAGRETKPVQYRILLFLTAFGWFMIPGLRWVGLVFGALAFLEHQTKRPLEIGFDLDRVVINTLIRQQHEWAAFNNVVLKNGLLTLDFKNNRLLQREIAEDEEDDDVDEEEFNAYCRDRLLSESKS